MTRSATRAHLSREAKIRGYLPAQAEADEAVPVDHAHLSRYTLGDARLEREILGLFLAQLPLTIESLRFATTDRDWQIAAHTLKGSCRAVGAWQIANLAQEAERIAGGADVEAREAVLDAIDHASARVESYVHTRYPPEPEIPL
jgi:HPt (histidine-containing phosphotransfer) domain-containing protein